MIRRQSPCVDRWGARVRVLQQGRVVRLVAVYGTAPKTARIRAAVTAVAAVLTVTSCSADSDTSERTPPAPSARETSAATSSSSPSPDPDESSAADAAMAVYRDLSDLVQGARRDPAQDWLPAYTQLTADPYRSAELLEISALNDRGITHTGDVLHAPEVVEVDLAGGTDGTLGTVTIEDCVDTRQFPATVEATGEVVSAERPPHIAVATLVFYPPPESRWLVSTIDVRDETC